MNPIFLVGAALVGLPVVLHLLLRQQPKKLVFPALRFLKVKQKTSERKVRLRHFLLLLLRCLMIALFALALYQPTLRSAGSFQLGGEQPLAVVLVLDTSPSMGYRTGTTRLEEAKRRALDLLAELPTDSKIAVLFTSDDSAEWQKTVLEARQRIESFTEPSSSTRSITESLRQAYVLLKSADAELSEGADPMPKLVALFGDRAGNSWDAGQTEELKKLRDEVPAPAPVAVFFDLGAEKSSNLSLTLQMKPQQLSGSADAVVNATVRAEGPDVGSVRVQAIWDDGTSQEKELSLSGGSQKSVNFVWKGPKPGWHSVRVKLNLDDPLPFDNERVLAFSVAPKRKILTLSDDPADADFWQFAHNFGSQEFDCTVAKASEAPAFDGFEAVVLLAVVDPEPLAAKLKTYVQRGGKLLIAPDGPNSDDKRADAYESLGDLLPAPLGPIKVWELPNPDVKRKFGVPWKIDDERDLIPPLLAPLRAWQRQGNVDVFKNPRTVSKFRTVKNIPKTASVQVWYDDAGKAEDRSPAVLVRNYEQGMVLLLTTRLDTRASDDAGGWNNYWLQDGGTWSVVFPWITMRYLCGSPDDANFNYPSNRPLKFKRPASLLRFQLEGPGVAAADSEFNLKESDTEIEVPEKLLKQPGLFALKAIGGEWETRFGLSVPPEESALVKVPAESIQELFGPNGIAVVDQKVNLRDLVEAKYNRTLELFPSLIALLLLFFALEGLIANRFYRLK